MAERKASRFISRVHKRSEGSAGRQWSAIVGGALIVLALFWFAWLLARQFNPALRTITISFPGASSQNTPGTADNPLAAAGVTLTQPAQGQEPTLTRAQALLLVAQLEPAAAAHAGGVDAQYTLFSYSHTGAGQVSFHNTPVWLIHYSNITEPPPDTSADPQAARVKHDFYVFLAANSGQELLVLWL